MALESARRLPVPVEALDDVPAPLAPRQAADYVVEQLVHNEIVATYGIGGGSAEPLLDAMGRSAGRMRFVLSRHETAACFQAVAHWSFSGRTAAVLTTSGAGLFNACNGIYEAYASRVPLIVLAGGIPRAFHETANFQNMSGRAGSPDATRAFEPLTVFTRAVERVEDLPDVLEEALRATRGPRRGPALVILPKDVQTATIDARPRIVAPVPMPEHGSLDAVVAEIRRAKRPLVVVGEGVKRHGARLALVQLVEQTNMPVVVTPGGKDGFPNHHSHFLGPIGLFGRPQANEAARAADLLLFIGATEDPFNCFSVPLGDRRRASILEGDGDWTGSPVSFAGDLGEALPRAMIALGDYRTEHPPASTRVVELPRPPSADEPLTTNSAVARIGRLLPGSYDVLYECGLVAAAAIHDVRTKSGAQCELTLTSASMGFAVAGGIGAAIARPDRRVAVVTADGSLLMNGTEIHTAVAEGLDVLFVVMNNGGHGIGKKAQERFYEGRVCGTTYPAVDCARWAAALGAPFATRVATVDELERELRRALDLRGVRVVEVVIAAETAPPMLTFQPQRPRHEFGPIG